MLWRLALLAAMLTASLAYAGDVHRETVRYTHPDGKDLKGSLFLPKEASAEARPAILLIHGSGWRIGTRHLVHWYAREFAKNGYVALAINYRKMPDYPYPHCVHDAKAAVRWLRLNAEKYGIDPERIGVFGNSAGGNLAGFLAATDPEDGLEGEENPGPSSAVKAAVVLYGAMDMSLYADPKKNRWINKSGRRYMLELVGAKNADDLKAFAGASPITYVTPETAPTLLIHGTTDFVVKPEHANRYEAKLKECGVPTNLIWVEHGWHGFDYLHHRKRAKLFKDMLAWFDQYLRDGAVIGQ
ncbi:MAG: alpha/beta hydrolase [FCB group bacterium]|nr:alpha/beta hydrolase [FCB group bacterium]